MKKVRIILLLALLLLVPFSLKAPQRLSDMTVVCATGVDYIDGEYTVTLQYLNMYAGNGKSDGITGNITSVAHGVGGTIFEAINNIQTTVSDTLFFGQNEIIVIGRNVEKNVLHDCINVVGNRRDVVLARSSDTAREVIENPQRGAVVPANSIVKQLKLGGKDVSVNAFLKNNSLTLPVIIPYEKYCGIL